jgi:(R,R)-butanediol dehydrogenase/meso-butanediol dehydrogenase/diacetyl reductase
MPTMRAARWYAARDVRVTDVELLHAQPGQVLVEVERVGICGTDIEEYLDGPLEIPVDRPDGLTLGHEVVGRVIECPGGEIALGQRVVPDVVVGCGRCRWCARHEPGLCPFLVVRGLQADGGLAEYMLADACTCVLVPPDLLPDVAVFAEPLSVAVRCARKAGDLSGARVAVVGLGAIGTLALQVASLRGAGDIVGIDPVPSRREHAATVGATTVLDPAHAAAQLAGDAGADVVFECAGTQTALTTAIEGAARGATIVAVGIGAAEGTIPIREMILQEKHLVGSAAHVWDVDVQAAVSLLARGLVDPRPLIGHVVGLDDIVTRGFERVIADPTFGKVLVDPNR